MVLRGYYVYLFRSHDCLAQVQDTHLCEGPGQRAAALAPGGQAVERGLLRSFQPALQHVRLHFGVICT